MFLTLVQDNISASSPALHARELLVDQVGHKLGLDAGNTFLFAQKVQDPLAEGEAGDVSIDDPCLRVEPPQFACPTDLGKDVAVSIDVVF